MSLNPSASFSTALKRTRSISTKEKTIPASRIPPLPKITGELILQVYTHTSLRRSTDNPQNHEHYDDNERLAELGKNVLDVAVTHALFNTKPMLKAFEICVERNKSLSDKNIQSWVMMYGMKEKLRCHPDVFASLDTPKEIRSIFCAYVGGAFTECGIEIVQDWIGQLLGQSTDLVKEEPLEAPQPVKTPPLKKAKNEPTSPGSSTIFFGSQPPASPPRQPPPTHHPPPNPLSPLQPNLPFLPLFNQTATQRRVTVQYIAEFSGPSHAGCWTIQCIVNGIPKGVGTGGSKQVAKEEAARQAYYAMGWT